MNPEWLIPIVVSIIVIFWKMRSIWRTSNRIGYLYDIGSSVGVAFLLYVLFVWMGTEFAGITRGFMTRPVIHAIVTTAYLICYVFFLSFMERRSTKAGPEEIEQLVKEMNYMSSIVGTIDKRNESMDKRVDRVEKDVVEKVEGAVKEQEEKSEVLKENVVITLNGFVKEVKKLVDDHGTFSRMMHERLKTNEDNVKEQRKNIDALEEVVKSSRGSVAEIEGHTWEDIVANRIRSLGLDAKIGRTGGQPDITVLDGDGNAVGIIGCKSYSLKTRHGMSDKFDPEVDFAGKEKIPLMVAIRNRLNKLEFFRVYDVEELVDFKCSTPTWLIGKVASEDDRDEQAKSRRKFKEFIADIS